MGTVATCSTTEGNNSCRGLAPSFFEEMTHCRRQKHRWRWPGNPNGRLKFRKYRIYLRFYICLRLRDRDCCSTADGNGSCHALALSFFEDITHCRRQKHRRRYQATIFVDWNSANIVYTFEFYVCLRLRDRDCCSAADGSGSCHRLAQSFFEQMTRCRCQKTLPAMTMIYRNSAFTKIYAYEIKQDLSKNIFFIFRMPPLWFHCALFFSYYHSQRLFFSPMKKIIFDNPDPHRKTVICILKCFFCRFCLCQNHWYNKQNIFFSIFKQASG